MTTTTLFQKPAFVVNPNSANRTTGRDWPAIESEARRYFPGMDVRFTSGPMQAAELARAALRDGADLIVSVGGDGTHNEVINGFFEAGTLVRPGSAFAVLSRGTGGDFRKTLGLGRCFGKAIAAAVAELARCRLAPCDVGKLTFIDHTGRQAVRMFINITSFGIGGEVDAEVNRATKALGGKASFFIGSFRATLRYRNRHVRVAVDGCSVWDDKIYNVAVANGRYFGGGMMIAPNAEIDDGLFEVVFCGDFSFGDALRLGTKIYKGAHLGLPKVRCVRGRCIEAYSDECVLLDVDGEQPGRLPAKFEIMPAAIQVLRLP